MNLHDLLDEDPRFTYVKAVINKYIGAEYDFKVEGTDLYYRRPGGVNWKILYKRDVDYWENYGKMMGFNP